MFRVKICGVTTAEDARLAIDAGAGAIGINFYPHSRRYVSDGRAAEIVQAVGLRALKVGVFVNASVDEVVGRHAVLKLDLVQLHGDEPPEFLRALGELPLIRAFRCGPQGLGPIAEYLEACRILGRPPRMVLIDAYCQTQYGGSGEQAPWDTVARFPDLGFPYPLILAGGLTPENVAAGINRVHPAAVDVASGVEGDSGGKDAGLIRAFVDRAHAAFAQTDRENRGGS